MQSYLNQKNKFLIQNSHCLFANFIFFNYQLNYLTTKRMPKIARNKDSDFEFVEEAQSDVSKKYDFISYQTRVRLIKMVLQDKVDTHQASATLDLKVATAEHILKSFCRKGKIHRKKWEKNIIVQEDLVSKQDIEDYLVKVEKERLENIAKKQGKKEIKVKTRKGRKYEAFYRPNRTINEVSEQKGSNNLIKEQTKQALAQYFPKILPNDVLKSEYQENSIKMEVKQYYSTLIEMNLNDQYLKIDPSIKNQNNYNLMIGPDFPDYYLVHPYFL